MDYFISLGYLLVWIYMYLEKKPLNDVFFFCFLFFRGMLTLWMCGLFGLMENMVGIDDLMIKFPPKTFKCFVLLWKLYRWKNVMGCSRHAYITLWLPDKLFLPMKMVASTKCVNFEYLFVTVQLWQDNCGLRNHNCASPHQGF